MTALLRRLLPYLRLVRIRWVQTALLRTLSPVLSTCLLWSVKDLIDQIFVAGRIELLPRYLALYSAIVVAGMLRRYMESRIDAAITERIGQDVRSDLYRHIVSLSPGSLKVRTGDLLMRLAGDADQIEYLIYSGLQAALANVIGSLVLLGVLLALNWQLTLCAVAIVPVLVWGSFLTAPRIRRSARIARRSLAIWSTHAQEKMDSIPLVQSLCAESFEADEFARKCSKARLARLRMAKLQAGASLLLEALAALGGLAVIVVGAFGVHQGTLTVGTLVAFLGSVGYLQQPIRSLTKTPAQFQRAAVRVQRITALLDTKSVVAERANAKPLVCVRGRLEFRNVHFAYGREPVLNGIDLVIEPGESVALVGANGSGKSSLLKLAIRLHDPSAGIVAIDGHDIREFTLRSLRRTVSLMFQDSFITSGSVAENIAYGLTGASELQVRAAARAAQAADFIARLPAGYETQVGPHGAWLSGGQRQRIALARSLLRESSILLFDEATASIDGEAEALIQQTMERLRGKRTIVVVGHRLSSIRSVDRIAVVENGCVVETGPPSRLLKSGSRYRELFAAQLPSMELSA